MGLPIDDRTALLRALVDVQSASGAEAELADLIEQTLAGCPWLRLHRDGNALVAATALGRASRVIIAGHLDTVPPANNLPSRLITGPQGAVVWGRGAVDMKGGLAVMLELASTLSRPSRDVSWIFYDGEEIEEQANGLARLARRHPKWLTGDFAVLMEPTATRIEGGCQGTMRFTLTTHGIAAHSARGWLGHNAIHDMAPVLDRIRQFTPRVVRVDGLTYREGLNATMIAGGVAGNVIPDRCTLQVNFRFAPDLSPERADEQMRALFALPGVDLEVLDLSGGARPGLDLPVVAQFCQAVGGEPAPKYGWTDVARFAALGIPAVNYGPGDPGKAHADDESCPVADLDTCSAALSRWLTGTAGSPS